MGVAADPAAVQDVGAAIDAPVDPAVMPFWRALLGYRHEGEEDPVDPHRREPSVWFRQVAAPRPQRNRPHLEASVPHDRAEARVAAANGVGGHLVTGRFAPAWWVPAGAEAAATWIGRE